MLFQLSGQFTSNLYLLIWTGNYSMQQSVKYYVTCKNLLQCGTMLHDVTLHTVQCNAHDMHHDIIRERVHEFLWLLYFHVQSSSPFTGWHTADILYSTFTFKRLKTKEQIHNSISSIQKITKIYLFCLTSTVEPTHCQAQASEPVCLFRKKFPF